MYIINAISITRFLRCLEHISRCSFDETERVRSFVADDGTDGGTDDGTDDGSDDGTCKHQVIVKFTTWHHRTQLYKNRKNLDSAREYI